MSTQANSLKTKQDSGLGYYPSHKTYLPECGVILFKNNIPPTPIRKIQTGNYLIRITNRTWSDISSLRPGWLYMDFHDFTSGHWFVGMPSSGKHYIFYSKNYLKYIPADLLRRFFR